MTNAIPDYVTGGGAMFIGVVEINRVLQQSRKFWHSVKGLTPQRANALVWVEAWAKITVAADRRNRQAVFQELTRSLTDLRSAFRK